MKPLVVIAITTLVVLACNTPNLRKTEWFEPCHDEARLLATTAGSPGRFECPNQKHKMQVQIATGSSNEEFGALVFCKCVSEQ